MPKTKRPTATAASPRRAPTAASPRRAPTDSTQERQRAADEATCLQQPERFTIEDAIAAHHKMFSELMRPAVSPSDRSGRDLTAEAGEDQDSVKVSRR